MTRGPTDCCRMVHALVRSDPYCQSMSISDSSVAAIGAGSRSRAERNVTHLADTHVKLERIGDR